MTRVSGISTGSTILVRFGIAIRAERRRLHMSQEVLADAAGIDRSHMGKIERGERNVTILNIERIATALEIRPSTLFHLAEASAE